MFCKKPVGPSARRLDPFRRPPKKHGQVEPWRHVSARNSPQCSIPEGMWCRFWGSNNAFVLLLPASEPQTRCAKRHVSKILAFESRRGAPKCTKTISVPMAFVHFGEDRIARPRRAENPHWSYFLGLQLTPGSFLRPKIRTKICAELSPRRRRAQLVCSGIAADLTDPSKTV